MQQMERVAHCMNEGARCPAPRSFDVSAILAPRSSPALHPLHALLLAFPVALFPGALLSDITYLESSEMQWSNFSAWLITGALVFGGLALAWSIAALFFGRPRRFLVLVLALMWIAGLVNAFQHSHDGWSSVGTTGLVLSIVSSVLALVAGWNGYSAIRETRA